MLKPFSCLQSFPGLARRVQPAPHSLARGNLFPGGLAHTGSVSVARDDAGASADQGNQTAALCILALQIKATKQQ